jgi:hypothetical protein
MEINLLFLAAITFLASPIWQRQESKALSPSEGYHMVITTNQHSYEQNDWLTEIEPALQIFTL